MDMPAAMVRRACRALLARFTLAQKNVARTWFACSVSRMEFQASPKMQSSKVSATRRPRPGSGDDGRGTRTLAAPVGLVTRSVSSMRFTSFQTSAETVRVGAGSEVRNDRVTGPLPEAGSGLTARHRNPGGRVSTRTEPAPVPLLPAVSVAVARTAYVPSWARCQWPSERTSPRHSNRCVPAPNAPPAASLLMTAPPGFTTSSSRAAGSDSVAVTTVRSFTWSPFGLNGDGLATTATAGAVLSTVTWKGSLRNWSVPASARARRNQEPSGTDVVSQPTFQPLEESESVPMFA